MLLLLNFILQLLTLMVLNKQTKKFLDIFNHNDILSLDEKPYCIRHRYKTMLSEGAPTGSFVLKIEARDADLNPKLRYYLTGHGAEHFSLDIDNGNFILKQSFLVA